MEIAIDTIILDVDKTMYVNEDISLAYDLAMISLVEKTMGVGREDAQKLIEAAKAKLENKVKVVSSTRALLEMGITLDDWISFSCANVDPRNFLEKDKQLFETITIMVNQRYKMCITSNNNRTQVERTFEALGVKDLLKNMLILSISETKRLKPDNTIYMDALRILDSNPASAIAIGDRQDVDLDPAREIGMHTYLVKTMEDLYKFPSYLSRLNSSS